MSFPQRCWEGIYIKDSEDIFMKKGFTLIELLVVVLIIGILAAIALPQYQKTVEKTRAVEASINIKNIYKAERLYFLSTGAYTKDLSLLDITLPGSPVYSETEQKTRYHTANFRYAAAAENSTGFANAFRVGPSGEDYYGLTVDFATGKTFCFWKKPEYETICRNIGSGTADICLPPQNIPCYYL
jgi:prepilin-type N-terminal cleavage/methylation domain-containing protein